LADSAKFSDIQNGPKCDSFSEGISDAEMTVVPRFSINQMTTLRASFEEDLSARQLAGVAAIGLWRKKIVEVGESAAVEAVRRSGLDVTTLSYAGGFSGSAGLQFREALDDGYDALFTAAAVGARTLIVSPGSRARYTARHEFRLVTQAIRELSFVAEELDVQLAVMPRTARHAGRWTSLHSLEQAITLCDATGRSNVGVAYDTFYLAEDGDALSVAEQCAERIFVLQLNDALDSSGPEYAQCVPGAGNLPVRETIQSLYESGFSGDVDVQIFAEEIWKQDVNDALTSCQRQVSSMLRSCLAGASASVGVS
jgi:sugar phosphate isomerase/epimerase